MKIKNIIYTIFLYNILVFQVKAIDLEIDIFNSKYKAISLMFSKSIDDNKLCKSYTSKIINLVKIDLENSGAFSFNFSNEENVFFNKEENNFAINSIPYDNYDILISSKCNYDEEQVFIFGKKMVQ